MSVDTVRGIAVFLMIASHTVWFLSNEKNAFWNFMRSLGDAVCYITFLFVFGITTYFTMFAKDYSVELRNKTLKRTAKLLLAYYIIAFAGIIKDQKTHFDLSQIFKTLTFQHVPGFTEFLIPFIFYSLLFLAVRRVVNLKSSFAKRNALLSIIITGMILWSGGMLLSLFNTKYASPALSPYIAILSGGYNRLRFPLLQYSIVILLGVYAGFLIAKRDNDDYSPKRFFLNSSILSLTTIFILWSSELFKHIDLVNMFKRWPPSIFFITTGLSFALLSLYLCRQKEFFFIRFFSRIGTHSILLLVFHVVTLRSLELLHVQRTGNGFFLALYFFSLVIIPLCIGEFIRKNKEAQTSKKLYNTP